jgi:glycosyltransferase involved in cell wall biosynthesis
MIARLCAVLSYVVPEKIICCANKVMEVHGELGYCKRKLAVIPNGYDLSKLKPSEDARNWVREQFGVSSGEILLGMVGRYHPQKNHRNLLEALSLLLERGHSFRCVLVGTGMSTDNHSLLEEITKLGLVESILLTGPRTDIPELMNALDVHILSSSTEGFPNVVAEAMACGTPCVSTDVGDAAEIIADTGIVCPPESAKALAQSILMLLEEQVERPELWSNRKRRARGRIADLYSLERTVGMFESAWHLTE